MEIKHLLAAFIAIIVGTVLLGVIASEQATYSEFSKARNESFTINKTGVNVDTGTIYTLNGAPANPTDDSEAGCNISSLVMTNSTDNSTWTITTDYLVNASTGTFSLVNSATAKLTADNITYVSYSYCDDGYLRASWGRTMLALVPGFIALAILLAAVAMFYQIAKNTGIL